MLFISILLSIWFVLWVFFAWQRHQMLTVITGILMDTTAEGDVE